ncbi:MAG: thioredoxin [Candidatus Woesearchaeota archaeon]
MSEIELSPENFDETIKSEVPVIVDFWASWCGPCQMLGPIFSELSNEYDEKELKFAKCSTEDCPDVAGKYEISSIPCLIIFKAGKEIERIVGFSNKDMLKAKIDEALKK